MGFYSISCNNVQWKIVINMYICVCVCVCVRVHARVLNRFSHVQLLVTPWTAAYQAPPSMGFSRQEYWSAVPLSSLSESESEVTHSCPTLCNPMDCSPLGSSVHEIFQARVLEWVAIPFSRGSSRPRDWTCISCVSCIGRWILYH